MGQDMSHWNWYLAMACVCVLATPSANADEAVIETAQTRVRDVLRDPQSAEFRNLSYRQGRTNLPDVVCGEVNARNAFGGFVGYAPFVYDPRTDEAGIVSFSRLGASPPDLGTYTAILHQCADLGGALVPEGSTAFRMPPPLPISQYERTWDAHTPSARDFTDDITSTQTEVRFKRNGSLPLRIVAERVPGLWVDSIYPKAA